MKKMATNAAQRVNNNPAVWIFILSMLVTAFFGVTGFIGVYMFTEVSAAPKIYETIEHHDKDVDRILKKQDQLEQKIDASTSRIIDKIMEIQK